MINRITAEQVVAAFEAHPEIEPVRRSFVATCDHDNPNCVTHCCGTTILLVDRSDIDFDLTDLDSHGSKSCIQIADALGLQSEYIQGFIDGWDGYNSQELKGSSEEYDSGFHDGRTAWASIIKEAQ